VEDDLGAAGDQLFGNARDGEIASHGIGRKRGLGGRSRRYDVLQGHARDFAAAEVAVTRKAFDQFAPDHSGGAKDKNVQNLLPLLTPCFRFDRHCERQRSNPANGNQEIGSLRRLRSSR